MRLAIIVTHPIQYLAPVFRELAREPALDLKVFFGCDHGSKFSEDPNFKVSFTWDCQPTEGFAYQILSKEALNCLEGLQGIRLAIKAVSEVRTFKPDAVLFFAYLPAFITASTILLRSLGYKLMLRAETTDVALRRSVLKEKLRKMLLTGYYRQFSHFFPIGINSSEHYRRMGVAESSLTTVHYAVDVDYFEDQVKYWLPQRESLRAEHGFNPDDHVLLFCGKMFPPKNPLLIANALAKLPEKVRDKIWLLAVGEGVLRAEFEARIKRQLGKRTLFVGFKNQSELGKYYAIADTLVLPSRSGETWGLVVNEALQFGLRVIVSDRVGSGRDMVRDDETGSVFVSDNADSLADSIFLTITKRRNLHPNFKKLPHPKLLAKAITHTLRRI